MAGGEKRIKGIDLEDRISDLPDGIKECILELLCLKTSVKTSVLSSKWRSCWTMRKTFEFDFLFIACLEDANELKYARIIDRALLVHSGPIRKFELLIPRFCKVDTFDINVWLLILSRNGIQNFEIEFDKESDDDSFPIPSYLFRCLGLSHIRLCNCTVRPPPEFRGFLSLVSLELNDVGISARELEKLISLCPWIETLSLTFDEFGYYEQPLVVNAPNLKKFGLMELVPGDVVLETVPSLTSASFRGFGYIEEVNGKVFSWFERLASIHRVEELSLNCQHFEFPEGSCPDTLPKSLLKLKSLTLEKMTVWSPHEISFAFCLIRSASSLQTLKITLYDGLCDLEEAALHFLETEGGKESILSKLLTIKIEYVWGWEHEIKLVKVLLARCPALETIHINGSCRIQDDAEKLMTGDFMRFRRLSSKAELIYFRSVDGWYTP